MKITYSQLCDIREIFNKYDLEELINVSHAPPDEYYSEVDMIIEQLTTYDTKEIENIVNNVFARMFGKSSIQPYNHIYEISREIRDVLIKDLLHVTAAIIRKDEKILLCQREMGGNCSYLWEFPGGKLELGETLEECLIRECKEELEIIINVKDVFAETTYKYPEKEIAFTFFNADIVDGIIKINVHKALQWVSLKELRQYEFCPADVEIIKMLIC